MPSEMPMQKRWINDTYDFASECQQRVVDAMHIVGWHCTNDDEVILVNLHSDDKWLVDVNGQLHAIM